MSFATDILAYFPDASEVEREIARLEVELAAQEKKW
jgi:hypothetical protein